MDSIQKSRSANRLPQSPTDLVRRGYFFTWTRPDLNRHYAFVKNGVLPLTPRARVHAEILN